MSAFRSVLELPSSTSLPADPWEAGFIVVSLIETQNIALDGHDETIVKCDGRFFLVVDAVTLDVVEVSSFAAQRDDNADADWPVDAGDFDPYRDIPAYQLHNSVADALSIEFYMDEARLQATGMAVRPGVGRALQIWCIVLGVAMLITVVGAFADDGMERCQQTASFDTCSPL